MKYILYIDYSAFYKPMTSEYRALNAKTLAEAIIEADAIHDPEKMYLIRIMEKRSTKWSAAETNHSAKHFIAKFGNWFEIA